MATTGDHSIAGHRSVWSLRRARRDPLAFLASLPGTEPVAEFWIAGQHAFLLRDAPDIQDVLVANAAAFTKPEGLRRAGRLLGRGLLTADGPVHTARRRLAQPAFSRSHVDRYARTAVEQATALSAAWRQGDVIDLREAVGSLSLCIAGQTLFGVDLMPDAANIRAAVADASQVSDPLVSLLAPARHLRPARERLRAIVTRLVADRLSALASGSATNASRDVLTMLCQAHTTGDDLALEQLHDDVLTLLLASHDTVSTALVSTWSLLGQHPRAEAILHEELDALAGPIDGAALPRLSRTAAIFTESLRLQPPAWIIAREARVDHVVRSGQRLPQGSLVVMSPYLLHRDARYFDDPLAFDPNRWLREPSVSTRSSFIPFGAGPRACIGESFAMMEGVLLLAVLGQTWRLVPTTPGPLSYDVRITLRPAGPVLMRLEHRHPNDGTAA